MFLPYDYESYTFEQIKESLFLGKIKINKVDIKGETLLCYCSKMGYETLVKIILENPEVDVNLGNDCNTTPLINACMNEHLNIIKLLLDMPKIDINLSDEFGMTPLASATITGNKEIIDILKKKGAHVDHTPITASKLGLVDELKKSIRVSGCDVNMRDEFDRTALHWATNNGHLEAVKILLDNGAKLFIKDEDDNQPLDLARDENIKCLLIEKIYNIKKSKNIREKIPLPHN